ncbi:Monoglyceride lipase, partial [Araneus ventricosus]
ALLLLSHGMTEHSMLYDSFAQEMVIKGFFVFAHDHIGHGYSDGSRAYINDVQELVEDSVSHIQMIRKEYPELPLFVCGHSMGGAVTVFLSLQVQISGMVLIAPALAANPETATFFTVTIAKFMSKFFPFCPMAATDFSLSTRNENFINEIKKDKLCFQGYWSARTIVSLLQAAEEISAKFPEIKVPFLVLHGCQDKICHVDGSRRLFELASSTDKGLKVYPLGYHSLLNEPDDISTDVVESIVEWFERRVDY